MPFSVERPRSTETPVVVEVPHAGLGIDALSIANLTAPVRSVGVDADLYVDDLYRDAPDVGATLLVSNVSRYVCDLNRGEGDVDALTVSGGTALRAPHGLIWRDTTEGVRALRRTLPRTELVRRLQTIYRPYHEQLQALLVEKRQKFGFVILLAAHSMPSCGRKGHRDTGTKRADVVPGSRGRTSATGVVIDTPDKLARSRGWSVAHDAPYRGGFTTTHYGRPEQQQHAVQVELSRALYMDEDSLEKLPTFAKTQAYCQELVQHLGQLKLGHA